MNTATQQSAPQQPATGTTPIATTFEQRVEALHEELQSEASSQSAGEPGGSELPPPAVSPATSSAVSEDALTKARDERRARLEALKADERARVDERARKSAGDELARELEKERQARAELEKRTQQLVDISKLDEAAFFKLAQDVKIPPQKLGEWIRESLANPEAIATQAATKHIDPRLAEMQAKLDSQQALINEFLEGQRTEREQHQAHQATQGFLTFVSQSSETAPIASQFLAKHGPAEFLKIAETAGASIPEGAGAHALLDAVESFLDGDGRMYAQQLAELYGLIPPSNAQHTPPPKSAAAKAKTVSNADAQERASVVSESELAKLSFDERLEALKRAF